MNWLQLAWFSLARPYQGRCVLHDVSLWQISGNYLAKSCKFHHCLRMNVPPADETLNARTDVSLSISNVRGQIDSIDAQIAQLIVQRCNLSASVAQAKRQAGDTAFGWRPAREVEIMRTLLQGQASLNPELAFCVWRALISANLAAQGDLVIYTTGATQQAANEAFSVAAAPKKLANAQLVFEALLEDDHAVGVMPWPDCNDWWVTMMESRFSTLHVCAASPIAGIGPQVMLVAQRIPEPAGDDISLVAGPIGLFEGGEMDRSGSLALVSVGEFFVPETVLPAGCRLIGSFALA